MAARGHFEAAICYDRPMSDDRYEEEVDDPSNLAMRAASGRVNDNRRLVQFLYVLGRDKLPIGAIEGLLMQFEGLDPHEECLYTNGWLAQWAKYTADRLSPPEIEES